MKAMRAKFYHPFAPNDFYEVTDFKPKGRYWRMPIEILPTTATTFNKEEQSVTFPSPHVAEFYLQGVHEDENGQYYHYVCCD